MNSDPSVQTPSLEYQEAMAAWLAKNPSPAAPPPPQPELGSLAPRNVELAPPELVPVSSAPYGQPMDAEQTRRWRQQEDLQSARSAGMFALAILTYESGSGWKLGGEVVDKSYDLLVEVIARLRAGLDDG